MKRINTRIFLPTLQSVLTRHISEIGATNLFLLFILAIITFYPLFFGGFTTHDDAYIAINQWNGLTWELTKSTSVTQGRFVFFWGLPLSAVPFIIDNRLWYLAIKFGSFFLLLSTLYYAVFQLFRSSWIALVSLAFFLTIIQNGWEHNAVTSYAFLFNFYASLFLGSLGLFATALERKSLVLASLSGLLYFFALGTELFVLFFPFYVVILLSRSVSDAPVTKQLMAGKNYIFAIALPLIVYLVIYLLWRHLHPSSYEGNSLNGFNLLDAVKVVATYSLTAFPLASLHFYTAPNDPLPFTNSVSLSAILSGLNVAHVIKPIVAGFLFVRLMTTTRFIVPQTRTLLIGVALAGIGIFLPNLLLGLVLRHQSWVNGGTYSYVYTYYSFISAVVFLALLLAYTNSKSRSWHPWLKLIFISMVVVAIMILGFAVEVRNQHFALDQKLAHRKWQLMDKVIQSPAFMEVPDGSTIVAPTLLSSTRGYAAMLPDDWSNYIKYKTGKKIHVVDNKRQGSVNCYVLTFRQEPYSDNQFMVLAKVKQPDSLLSSELTIFIMPAQANPVLVGSFIPGEIPPKLAINGKPVLNIGTRLFASNLSHSSANESVQTAKITGNIAINPDQMTISHYAIEPHLRPLSDELAEGIDFTKQDYPDFLITVTGMAGHELTHRWTQGKKVIFTFKQNLPANFMLELDVNGAFGSNIGKMVQVQVGDWQGQFVALANPAVHKLMIKSNKPAESIELIIPEPTSPKSLGQGQDRRELGIMLKRLSIIAN